ncbi:hypothetical protein X945_5271 [Burkholderia pseudomallei ABCPW 107]|nr:hypothetical protein X945_5271 [Burkholderia pseudomallei ABCPW 107]
MRLRWNSGPSRRNLPKRFPAHCQGLQDANEYRANDDCALATNTVGSGGVKFAQLIDTSTRLNIFLAHK